jgi:ABC-type nitrate/sulfonate/bicarbonate transport system substrate-binding protein
MEDQSLQLVRLGYFTRSAVVQAGELNGHFAAQGLRLELQPAESSPGQFRTLAAGTCDLVLTSPDNVAAYRLTAVNPLQQQLDVRIVLAVDGGLGLSVVSRPEIGSMAGLRGATVGVDVPQSGFALALYELLREHGLDREDCRLVSLGSTPKRAEALLSGQCDATLLNAGHDVAAVGRGFRRLARVTDHLRPYLGTVLAGHGPWLDGNSDLVCRFATAWLTATADVLDARPSPELDAMLAEVYALPPEAAQEMRQVLASADDGLVADGLVRWPALSSVLEVRRRYLAGDAIPRGPAQTVASGLVGARWRDGTSWRE